MEKIIDSFFKLAVQNPYLYAVILVTTIVTQRKIITKFLKKILKIK